MSTDKLDWWMSRLVPYVRSGAPDLTNRQMALVLLVYGTDGPHTVRGMAKVMKITKPAVTRALATLCRLNFLQRERDVTDRRSIFIKPTVDGYAFLTAFNDMIERTNGL